MRRILLALGVLIIAAAMTLMAGCITTPASSVKEIRIGYQPSTHQMAHITAMEKGWWKEDLSRFGVETVTDYQFPSGPPEMTAMQAGQIDVAYTGSAPLLTAISTGLDAKIVAAVQMQGSDLVLRNEIPYSSPADLRGLSIGTFPPGSIQDTILRNWLKENGLEPDRDVSIKAMAPGDAVTAIAAGQIDGVFLPHPSPSVIAAEGKGRTVVRSGEMDPNHACCVLAVSGNLIREHPEIVEQLVRTHIRATQYNAEHPEEAAAIYAAKTDAKYDQVIRSVNEWDGAWIADPNVIVDSVTEFAQIQYELGYIKKPLTRDEIFDLSFYEKARA
ncbi:MAG: ABC transporter substrate-binding protein [Methanomicrobiales archaeon]|nr:ABC transporter substrate-binding protein [Methanomicrobiales archaeon]MDI6875687.1 ABC transporter substrate-binding protein [Methanomicrobiales archaeon]